MEFKSLKNIETSFRQIRLFALVFICLCAVVTGFALWKSYSFAEKQREKIYVLDNGKSLMLALSQDVQQPGGSTGTRAQVSRTVLHVVTRQVGYRKQYQTLADAGGQERIQLLQRPFGKGVLQPGDFGEYQPDGADRQRAVRL